MITKSQPDLGAGPPEAAATAANMDFSKQPVNKTTFQHQAWEPIILASSGSLPRAFFALPESSPASGQG